MCVSEVLQSFEIVLNPPILLVESQFFLRTVLTLQVLGSSSHVVYHIIEVSVVELNYTMFLRNRTTFTVHKTIVAMRVEAAFELFLHNFL